jgi:GSH-dependent disulfide-bond oxidoreductase
MSFARASAPPLRFSARARMVLNGVKPEALFLKYRLGAAVLARNRPRPRVNHLKFVLALRPRLPSVPPIPRAAPLKPRSTTPRKRPVIRFYFNLAPNPMKIALMLEELGQPYEAVPVDTAKGEQHAAAFRAINPNGKVLAIVDSEGPGGREARVFDSSAILLYLGEKTGRFIGSPADRPDLLSWLFFIATGVGPYSGQAVHFQHAAPEKLPYAVNRYRREIERHYRVLDKHLDGKHFIVGGDYSIADMSVWGWLTRASRVLPGADDPLAEFPNLKRLYETVDARPAAVRARAIGKDHRFKTDVDEETKRAMFPSNYPEIAM